MYVVFALLLFTTVQLKADFQPKRKEEKKKKNTNLCSHRNRYVYRVPYSI